MFIDNIACDNYRILIETVIAYAHHSGEKVIAEGVETKAQLDILKEMGCDYVQGYYFCKPLPLNELVAYLSRPSRQQIAGFRQTNDQSLPKIRELIRCRGADVQRFFSG
jgi:EAL domain-containing protein (putative c-di-GMP-specific phosphodiesterase class I)